MPKKILFALSFLLLFSCIKEEILVAKADFIIEPVDDNYNAPAFFKFTNSSTGGEQFEWTFEGGTPSSSTQFNPDPVKYEQEGTYTVTLKVSNKDGAVSEMTKEINVGKTLIANFSHEVLINDFAPVEVTLTNLSLGANSYQWTFAGGNPASTTAEHPANVVFTTPGIYTVKLEAKNSQNQVRQKSVTLVVKPPLATDFKLSVDPIDEDYQIPVTVTTNNTTTSATSYSWEAMGANPSVSTATNPEFVYTTAGTYTIKLTATNGKSTQIVTKTVTVVPNTNLSIQTDIKLGISTAVNTIGCFYSTTEKKVYKESEINSTNGSLIDIVFFGLNNSFSNNRFISPSVANTYSFNSIPNATATNFINKQEDCNCGVNITPSQFDAMANDNLLQSITVTNQETSFSSTPSPRIIPFKTQDGRKGLIKLKSFINDGVDSFILIDIKMQKEP